MIFKNEKRPQCTKCLWQLTTDGDCVNPDCDWYVLEPVSLRSQMPRSVKSSVELDTAVESLLGLIQHNKAWEGLQEVDVEAYQQAADTLRALLARADIDQSAYEELLRESKRQAQRIKELEADRDAAVMDEREACHRVAVLTGESMAGEGRQKTVDAICAAIRARSNNGLQPARFAETHEMVTQNDIKSVFGDRIPMRFVKIILQKYSVPLELRRALNRALDDET